MLEAEREAIVGQLYRLDLATFPWRAKRRTTHFATAYGLRLPLNAELTCRRRSAQPALTSPVCALLEEIPCLPIASPFSNPRPRSRPTATLKSREFPRIHRHQ